MNNLTQKQKEVGLLLLSSLIFISIVAYSYFTLFAPKKENLAVAETTLANDRQVLFALEQQLADQPEIPLISSLELQKKVPVEPLTELIILQVEKAEVVSQSLVQSISFTEGPFVIESPPEGVETLQQLLVSLTIETPNYSTLEAFIDSLEKLERILVVDSIQFSTSGEVTSADQLQENLLLTLSFSTFYRPDLITLLEEVPKVDTPAPADKTNPLPSNDVIEDGEVVPGETVEQNTDLTEESSETEDPVESVPEDVPDEEENVSESQSNSGSNNITYRVRSGDTLFSISMKYYGSRSGEERIKRANGLKSDRVVANTTLIIPK